MKMGALLARNRVRFYRGNSTYVYVHDRPDAQTVMSQLHNWIEDYNEHGPHKGLKMMSPRRYLRKQLREGMSSNSN